jgi:hypothetical protein
VKNRRSPRGRAFFGQDRYARFALGSLHETGSSFADGDIYVAARGVSQSVIPDIDESVLAVTGEVAEQVDAVRDVLLGRRSRRELWNEPTLPMELQAYVSQLINRGELFIHLYFDRSSESNLYSLFKTTWLAPETMLHREHRGTNVYEQFASRRAFEGSGYVVSGDPTDHLVEFPENEILHLRWPLNEPDATLPPARAALKFGKQVAREAQRSLLAARAGAEPTETYLPIARARAGAFADALERQKILSARIKDMLFYPGASEAEAFPWVDAITDYFAADRTIRSRIAICEIREYLLDEFNRQVIRTWSQLNSWREVRLQLRPVLFTTAEWRTMRRQLSAGELGLDDVRAAVHLEYETGSAFGRFSAG